MSVTTLQAIILWVIAAGVMGVIFVDYLRYKVHLLSIRNLLLFGFIVYQLLSPSYTLFGNRPETFRIDDLAGAAWQLILMALVFLAVFLFAYRGGWGVKKLAHRIPIYQRELSQNSMVLIAVVCTLLSAIMRATAPESVPAIYHVMFFSTIAFTTLSTGLVTWWWIQRPWNFARFAVGFITISSNIMIMLAGAFSRRPVVAITMMFVWTVYYCTSRYQVRRTKVVSALLISMVPLIILASMLTSARHHGLREQGATEVVRYIFSEGSIKEGMVDLLGGQLVGEASFWCIENYPENREYNHLFSVRYYFMSSIPRSIWPNKPYGLSAYMADYADVQGVNQNRAGGERGVTLPPGVIGYAAAEGGFYALIIYALIFGLCARFLDSLISLHPHRIAVVLPLAASLGNMIGMLRGDLTIFAVGATWSILASYLLLAVVTAVLGYRPHYHYQPTQSHNQ